MNQIFLNDWINYLNIEVLGLHYLILWAGISLYFLLCRLLVVGPVLKWLALLQCRLLVVGPVLKWLALCIYVCMYFSVFTLLATPLYIYSSNLACSSVSSSNDHLRIRFLI